MRAQVFRKERQHLLLQALRDAIAVIAFVGFECVRNAERRHPFHKQLVTGDQIVLQADVESDSFHLLEVRHVLIEHRDR